MKPNVSGVSNGPLQTTRFERSRDSPRAFKRRASKRQLRADRLQRTIQTPRIRSGFKLLSKPITASNHMSIEVSITIKTVPL